MLTFPILDNTSLIEKDLPLTRKKTITGVQKNEASKPSYFSKAKEPTVKDTPNAQIEAANVIASIVHSENNAVGKALNSKRLTTAFTRSITTVSIKNSQKMQPMPKKCGG